MQRVGLVVVALSMVASAASAAPANPLSARTSSKAPIEISADSLEVLQDKNRAIFVGHVVAVQQQVRLKSDKMTVFYRAPDEKPSKPAKESENNPLQSDAIQKIEVEGNVFLTTPQETASGTAGVYDVERQEIRLTNNVVLTKGKNTLKGDKLTYNLETGKSVISGGVASQPQDGKSKERVRALFVPDSKEGGK